MFTIEPLLFHVSVSRCSYIINITVYSARGFFVSYDQFSSYGPHASANYFPTRSSVSSSAVSTGFSASCSVSAVLVAVRCFFFLFVLPHVKVFIFRRSPRYYHLQTLSCDSFSFFFSFVYALRLFYRRSAYEQCHEKTANTWVNVRPRHSILL